MNIAIKPILHPKLADRLEEKFHGVIRAVKNARAQEKALDIIPSVKLHRQSAHLIRREGSPRQIIGAAADTILAIIDALVGEKKLEQRDAPSIRRKAVADASLSRVPQASCTAPAPRPAGGTGHVVLSCVREYGKLFLYG